MSDERHHGPRRGRGGIAGWLSGLALPTRRVIAAGIALAILVGCMLISAAAEADFENAGEAVRTQDHYDAVIVDHEPRFRSEPVPVMELNGDEYELDFGWILEGDEVGDSVRYVIDPEDPSHLIAVGAPSDWERSPLRGVLVTGVVLLTSLFAGGFVLSRIVPEDRGRIYGWFIDRRRRRREC